MRNIPFWSNIFSANSVSDTLRILESVPLFSELTKLELISLSKIMHVRHYFQNEVIFNEHEMGSGVYVVRSGSVRIYRRSESGAEIPLTILEEGAFFG